MAVHCSACSALWFRVYCTWLLFWDFCVSLGYRLSALWNHSNSTGIGLPLPATSSNCRPVNLPFPLAAFTKDSRCHRREFEACQTRLRQSVRLQKAEFQIPKRCTTPLLPLHEIPGQSGDEDDSTILSAPKQPWDEGSEISLSSSPSLTLHTPMSTSNTFHSIDPFAYHGDSLYTPPDHVGMLNSPFFKGSEDICLVDQTQQLHSRLDLIKPTVVMQDNGDTIPCVTRRQFCGCKNPCSSYVSISPTSKTFSPTDPDNMRIDPASTSVWMSDNLQRRQSIGTLSLPNRLDHRTLLEDPLLRGLELVLPKLSAEPWEEDLYVPLQTFGSTESIFETEKIVIEPSLALRCSDVYESWMSSWCFRPAIPRSPIVPLPEILASSPPQLGFNFLPPSKPSPRLSSRNLDTQGSSMALEEVKHQEITYLSPSSSIPARNSRVLSGMSKLQNLRDLLLILDQSMAASAALRASQLSDGQDEWCELDWEEIDSMWRLGSEAAAGRAF